VGLRYLESLNKRYYDHYFEKSTEVDYEGMKGVHVPFLAWFPPASLVEEEFVYCFDRNLSHTAVASQENMGVGIPEHFIAPDFDRKRAGLWDAQIVSPGGLHQSLPPLMPRSTPWLPTGFLRIAQIMGYSINVTQAVLWPEEKPVFERWAHGLWAYRQECTGPEREAVKTIANNTVGSTRLGNELDRMMRPDWYATIVGTERALVCYKAWKIAQAHGYYPCGAYADALYYRSFYGDPEQAVPGMLAHKNSLGGYKLAWKLHITPRVREILAGTLSAALRIAELKKELRCQTA
jgi:hypothetical protein